MERFCIDASVFLGMNSSDERIRVSCKNFFIENQNAEILMNFEQIGLCDHVIWSFPFELQSVYYPFMDLFHSVMPLRRYSYTEHTLCSISGRGISLSDKLNIAFAKEHNSVLYSLCKEVLEQSNTKAIPLTLKERSFTEILEEHYKAAKQLSIDLDAIFPLCQINN